MYSPRGKLFQGQQQRDSMIIKLTVLVSPATSLSWLPCWVELKCWTWYTFGHLNKQCLPSLHNVRPAKPPSPSDRNRVGRAFSCGPSEKKKDPLLVPARRLDNTDASTCTLVYISTGYLPSSRYDCVGRCLLRHEAIAQPISVHNLFLFQDMHLAVVVLKESIGESSFLLLVANTSNPHRSLT